MRPIATEQDYLRAPLNDLLGAPAHVRLLRLLSEEVSEPVGAPEAAEHTGLTEAGARRALKRLAATGFVEQIGGGRAQRFRLRDSDPLSQQLRMLFGTERERYDFFMSKLRNVLGTLPEVDLAWIDDPPTEADQPLHIGVLAGPEPLSYLGDQIRHRVVEIESEFDTTIEVHTFSRAEMPDVNWSTATLLAGYIEPKERPAEAKTHADRIARSRVISEAIVDLLDQDPSLLRRAQRHLDLLLDRDQGPAAHDLREWQDILSHYSRRRLKDFLVAETPRAQRLRQSSPFFAALTPDEREQVLDAVERES